MKLFVVIMTGGLDFNFFEPNGKMSRENNNSPLYRSRKNPVDKHTIKRHDTIMCTQLPS